MFAKTPGKSTLNFGPPWSPGFGWIGDAPRRRFLIHHAMRASRPGDPPAHYVGTGSGAAVPASTVRMQKSPNCSPGSRSTA